MPRMLPVFATILASATLLACRGPAVQAMGNPALNPSSAPGNQAATPMTPTPRNASLTTAPDQTVTIVLAGLATAGYEWTVLDGSFDPKVLRFKAKRTGDVGPNPLAGQSATEIFEFVGLAPGQTPITLVNARPWEGRQPDSDTARFTVTVK